MKDAVIDCFPSHYLNWARRRCDGFCAARVLVDAIVGWVAWGRWQDGVHIFLSPKSKEWIVGAPFKAYPDNVTFSNFFMFTCVNGGVSPPLPRVLWLWPLPLAHRVCMRVCGGGGGPSPACPLNATAPATLLHHCAGCPLCWCTSRCTLGAYPFACHICWRR